MTEIIKRKDAINQGLDRYYTGRECKNGHVAERYTRNGDCVECVRLTTEQRKDTLKEYSAEYYAKHKDEINRKRREKYHQNKNHS